MNRPTKITLLAVVATLALFIASQQITDEKESINDAADIAGTAPQPQ